MPNGASLEGCADVRHGTCGPTLSSCCGSSIGGAPSRPAASCFPPLLLQPASKQTREPNATGAVPFRWQAPSRPGSPSPADAIGACLWSQKPASLSSREQQPGVPDQPADQELWPVPSEACTERLPVPVGRCNRQLPGELSLQGVVHRQRGEPLREGSAALHLALVSHEPALHIARERAAPSQPSLQAPRRRRRAAGAAAGAARRACTGASSTQCTRLRTAAMPPGTRRRGEQRPAATVQPRSPARRRRRFPPHRRG